MNKKAIPKSSGCLMFDFYFILKYIIICPIFDQMVINLCLEYISFLCKYIINVECNVLQLPYTCQKHHPKLFYKVDFVLHFFRFVYLLYTFI